LTRSRRTDVWSPPGFTVVVIVTLALGIVGKKDLFPNQLSGGQQQVVGIARAVIHRPAQLLADEPTGNLHSSQAKEIMELFQQLNREGTTIVQVTHSEVNASYGSRVLEVQDGWLVGDTANPGLNQVTEVKA
jgi:putative ABC transport system ATP-binding protein